MKQVVNVLYFCLMIAAIPLQAQTNELVELIHNFQEKAAAGTPRSPEEAEPLFERFDRVSNENLVEALPVICQQTNSSYVSVRRLAIMSLFAISVRRDGRAMLSSQIAPFATFLVDPDIPIRRLTGLTIENLHLDQNSPLLPNLKDYLSREDAVSTIGAGVAGSLMKAAPDDPATITAVVRYIQRKDQNSMSRNDLLQSVRVARSHNRDIGKAVASYADDPNESTSVQAIQTLQGMGPDVVADNRQLFSKIAADSRRSPGVRAAATKAASATH